MITVGAVDVEAAIANPDDDFNAPWSAYGYTLDGFAKPELGAPGRYIIEWVPSAHEPRGRAPDAVVSGGMELSGTSFAAPVVSGIAADLLGLHPDWTPDQVKGALHARGDAAQAGGSAVRRSRRGEHPEGASTTSQRRRTRTRRSTPFLVPDPKGGPYPVFDSASWLKVAQDNASWNTPPGRTPPGTRLLELGSWNSASWNSDSFPSASWNSASWLKVLVTDNAANETGGEG